MHALARGALTDERPLAARDPLAALSPRRPDAEHPNARPGSGRATGMPGEAVQLAVSQTG
jgi:hypothetical protein